MSLLRSFTKTSLRQTSLIKIQKASRYYLLVPEVPNCSADNNSLMKVLENNELPPFASMQGKYGIEAAAKTALDFEIFASTHVDSFDDVHAEKSFENVLQPLNDAEFNVAYAWNVVQQKYNIIERRDQSHDLQIKMNSINRVITRTRNVQYFSDSFYRAVKEVLADKNVLDNWQQRLCEKYLSELRMNGAELRSSTKVKLNHARSKLKLELSNYWLHIRQTCIDPENKVTKEDINGAPPHLLYQWSITPSYYEGPYRIHLNTSSYLSYLKYCNSRMKRYQLWHYWNNRAAFSEQTAAFNNSLNFTDIRVHRDDEAKFLGFKTYSEKSLLTKMALSLDEIEEFLNMMREKCSKKFAARLKDMECFAKINNNFTDSLNPWDFYYFSRLLVESENNFDPYSFSQCFPFESAWNCLLKFSEYMFDLKFVDISQQNSVEVVDKDTKVYSVVDKNSGIEKGFIYVDPFLRQNKSTECSSKIIRSRSVNGKPVSYINLNVCKDEINETFLTLEQLLSLAGCFGEGLSVALCDCPYVNTFSTADTELDASKICYNVMKWMVLEPSVMRAISNQQLSFEEATKARRVYCEQSLVELLRETFLSEFDLTVYHTNAFWGDIYKEMYKKYYVEKANKNDNFPCSFTAITVENLAAGYYSSLWSEMVSCDIVSAFTEAGFDNEAAVKSVARKYRETYLTYGGGIRAREVFAKFRGRDVKFDYICDFYNLN